MHVNNFDFDITEKAHVDRSSYAVDYINLCASIKMSYFTEEIKDNMFLPLI